MAENETNESIVPEASKGIELTEDAQHFLYQAGKWSVFLGIIGFIGVGVIALMGVLLTALPSLLSKYQTTTTMSAAFGGAIGIFYLLMAVFHFFIARYLYLFGTRIKNGVSYRNHLEVTAALGKLKSLFKLAGITTIVIMSLYLLALIVPIAVAIVGLSARG